jgi:exopolysaccharide biosynthesis protein
MGVELQTAPSVRPPKRDRRTRRARRRSRWIGAIVRGFAALCLSVLLLAGVLVAVGFGTPWGNRWRMVIAETIVSTRHFRWARYITNPSEYAALLKQLNGTPVVNTGVASGVHVIPAAKRTNPVEIIPVAGSTYTGYVMLVHDPRLVRLVAANVHDGRGEYITDMARRTGAIAGVNASGFEDPQGSGWGGIAVGLEYVDGHVIQRAKDASGWVTVGFTRDGVMVMGNYTVPQLRALGVRDAMQFHPELVVNGQPTITSGTGGWGYDPRTAIGQRRDGTVIFVVLNGRFHGGAGLGASQRQVMDLMLQYGAVNACAMDGGSSSVLYYDGRIINSPSTIDPNGQRHLPDAWLVFPSEAAANAYDPGLVSD